MLQEPDKLFRFILITLPNYPSMKTLKYFSFLMFAALFIMGASSCKVFAPKSGCPANGKAVGAERILSGEKVPKAKKFRA